MAEQRTEGTELAATFDLGNANLDEEARNKRGFFAKLYGDIDELHEEGKITVGGASFVTHLTSMYWGCRGIPEILLDLALPPLLFKLAVPSATGQILMAMVFTPWAMKPFFAILSDLFPFAFYKKRFYMMAVSLGGAFACYRLWAASDAELGVGTGQGAFFYFFMANVAISMCDSLSQGKYTEICKWKGSTVVSYVSACKTLSGTLGALIGPSINDGGGFLPIPASWEVGPKTNLGLIMPFLAQASFVQGSNFMGDRPGPKCCDFDKAIWLKDFKLIVTGLSLGLFALSLTGIQLANATFGGWCEDGHVGWCDINLVAWLLPWCVIGLITILGMTFWSLPYQVAKINTYIIMCRIGALDFRYVLQQFYTAPEVHCQGTPHFPNTVYQMVGLVTGNLMTLFGVWLFENYVYYWNARRAFWVTTLFTMVAAFFDLMMLTGFNRTVYSVIPGLDSNVTWLCSVNPNATEDGKEFQNCENTGYRLDDLFGFLMGSQGIKYIATTLDDMPSTILLSKLCPAGVETTVFAMLAALMNLGLTFSGLLAAEFLKYHEVNIDSNTVNGTKEYTCDLGSSPIPGVPGLPWLVIIGGVILPGLTIPATFCFIPNIQLSDKFVADADEELTETGGESARHPAASLGRASPSFAELNAPNLAPAAELERAASLQLRFRSGNLSTSRLL